MTTLESKRVKQRLMDIFILSSTYRMETLNGASLVMWATLMQYGVWSGKGLLDAFPIYQQLRGTGVPLEWWIALMYAIGGLQLYGLVAGTRWARIVGAGGSGIYLTALGVVFTKMDYRYPYVSLGNMWAFGQFLALLHVVSAQHTHPLFIRKDVDAGYVP